MSLPRMLFIRKYHGLLGGHLKVFDYLEHVAASGTFEPVLYVTPESDEIPDGLLAPAVRRVTSLADADAYFVAGRYWEFLDRAGIDPGARPVVNLIQSFVHVDPGDARYAYLSRPALRICVCEPLRAAVAATGRANGPLVAIENGTDVSLEANSSPGGPVFVGGVKHPELARELGERLDRRGIPCVVQTAGLPRDAFLSALRTASIAVLLPLPIEGFFLPGLEAMALGTALVIPGTGGIRSYCADEWNALVTAYERDAILAAVVRLRGDPDLRSSIVANARTTAAAHTLERERERCISALRDYASTLERASV